MWTSLLLGSSRGFRHPLRRLHQFQSQGEGKKGGLKGFWGLPKAKRLLFHPSRGGKKEGILGKLFIKKGPRVGISMGKGRRS